MGVSQILRRPDGYRDKLRAYRIVPEGDHHSTAFDLSDGRTPLVLPFSTEPAAVIGKREKRVDTA